MYIGCNRNRYSIIGDNNTIYIHLPGNNLKTHCDWFLNNISICILVLTLVVSIGFTCMLIYCYRCLCNQSTRNGITIPSNITYGNDAQKHCLCIKSKT